MSLDDETLKELQGKLVCEFLDDDDRTDPAVTGWHSKQNARVLLRKHVWGRDDRVDARDGGRSRASEMDPLQKWVRYGEAFGPPGKIHGLRKKLPPMGRIRSPPPMQ